MLEPRKHRCEGPSHVSSNLLGEFYDQCSFPQKSILIAPTVYSIGLSTVCVFVCGE